MKHCLCVLFTKHYVTAIYYIYLLRLIIFCSTYVNTKNLHEMLDSIVAKSNYLKVHHSNINKRINKTFSSYYLYHIRIWHAYHIFRIKKDQDQYHIANIRAIFFQNIIYVNICKFEFNWKLKWHDTDFGKENAANGTPYVLLKSDMKKKNCIILKKGKKFGKKWR